MSLGGRLLRLLRLLPPLLVCASTLGAPSADQQQPEPRNDRQPGSVGWEPEGQEVRAAWEAADAKRRRNNAVQPELIRPLTAGRGFHGAHTLCC